MQVDPEPYWGDPTASVDWCEENYVHSHYVAEWFNTLSSIAIVAAGLGGLLLHRRLLERRFSLAFALVSVVGAGSIAFHATLQMEHQMLDELPMLYSALLMVFLLIENRPARRLGLWFPALLAAHAVLVTLLTALSRGQLQFYLFQISFGTLEFFCLFRIGRLAYRSEYPVLKRLFHHSLAAYGFAILCWFIDLSFCPWVSQRLPELGLFNPQLHAAWHVLVSVGLYGLLIVVACDRLIQRGESAHVSWKFGLLPVVRVVTE